MTASVVSFYNILIKFVNEACLLVKLPVSQHAHYFFMTSTTRVILTNFITKLYSTLIQSISNITEQYLRRMIKESQAREMAKDQRYAAMMNVAFVLDNVVPRISSQLNVSTTTQGAVGHMSFTNNTPLQRHFDRPIPELDTLRATLRGE